MGLYQKSYYSVFPTVGRHPRTMGSLSANFGNIFMSINCLNQSSVIGQKDADINISICVKF